MENGFKDLTIVDFVTLSVIVILLPMFTDLLNSLFPNARIGRIATEIVGIILVFFIVTLIYVAVYLWYCIYLPYYLVKQIHVVNILDVFIGDGNRSWVPLYIHLLLCTFIVLNLYYYYYKTIVSGIFSKQLSVKALKELDEEQRTRYCSRCRSLKTSTSFHCKVCNRCSEGIDHHCPYVNTCVISGSNWAYFYMFLWFVFFGLIYACYLSYFPFKDCYLNKTTLSSTDEKMCQRLSKFSMIFICAILLLIPASFIMIWQGYLLYTNTTTIHLLKNLKESPTYSQWFLYIWNKFKCGSIQNFKSQFPNWRFWNLFIPYNHPTLHLQLKSKIK
ncbi:DHHC-type zinc finger-containing protein [Tieghemostelium lacteum]|uniref:Palmitoyltransferase n=1 Tax=Tieghemostelium lacteum TaxID=361077 RepID=A0A151Z421_TIELA|nr:DHHC-type zinc finger-containing protein [Tieghemostelium lacteum]|eukprot:KYQ88688.1 DHHC-type zinc finger-containing protein [Tieghemostelium lacteum]